MAKEHCEEGCKDRLDRIEIVMTNIDNKLFRGNGSPPWDVRLDRCERLNKVLIWFVTAMTSTTFVIAGKIIYDSIKT